MESQLVENNSKPQRQRLLWQDSEAKHLFRQHLWPYYIGNKSSSIGDRDGGGVYPILLWKEQLPYALAISDDIPITNKKRKFIDTEVDNEASNDTSKEPPLKKQNITIFGYIYSVVSSILMYPFYNMFTTSSSSTNTNTKSTSEIIKTETTITEYELTSQGDNNNPYELTIQKSNPLGPSIMSTINSNTNSTTITTTDCVNVSNNIDNNYDNNKTTTPTNNNIATTPNNINKYSKEYMRAKIFHSIKSAGYFIGPGDVYGKS